MQKSLVVMTIACKRIGLQTTRIHTNTELKRSVFGLINYNNNAIISEITIKNIIRNLRIAAYLITDQFRQNKRSSLAIKTFTDNNYLYLFIYFILLLFPLCTALSIFNKCFLTILGERPTRNPYRLFNLGP